MTLHLFTAGELIRDPERKTSSNGNVYVSALLRVDPETVVSLTAFDTTLAASLAGLKKGSALACSGRLQARPYSGKDGTLHAGLGIVVSELMFGSMPPQRAAPRSKAKATPAAAGAGAAAPFDDDLPAF